MNKNNGKKPRIILLSDLWGNENADWIVHYTSILEKHFEVKHYDSCTLGNIDKSNVAEDHLHQQFINGGIEKAVLNLLLKENDFVNILAFSIGGTIAWKAALTGLKVQNLFAVSSTRLRYENQKPDGVIELFYGENDAYKPDVYWFGSMEIEPKIYPNEEHEFYRKKQTAEEICGLIIKSKK